MKTPSRKILDMNAFDHSSLQSERGALLHRRLKNLGAASVLFYEDPVEMVRASGVWMYGADGTEYLDFYNNVPSIGHCHPRVVEAIGRQLARLNIHTRYLNAVVDDYLESLKATFCKSLDNILLCCTGSEANDLALRIAAKRTGKRGFIVTETAYHGNTLATTEISPAALRRTSLPDSVVSIPAPARANYGTNVAAGFAEAVAAAITTLESRSCGFAGFICDSVFSSDGVLCDPAGFLAKAVEVVHERGGVYIADEVQPGFARTGERMWGFERHGASPDLVTMGKPMGNGFPLAGVAARSTDVQNFCEDVGYFNTFGGNPVAAAAGQAVLDVLRDENLQENALQIGSYLKEGLVDLAGDFPIITEVRGAGLFLGVDLCEEGDPARPAPDATTSLINALRKRRVLIGAAGKYGNTLKLRPPLCLQRHHVDFFLEALRMTLASS